MGRLNRKLSEVFHFNWTIIYVLLKNEHSLTYNQNDRFALFETYIKAAIQVLRFKSPSVYWHPLLTNLQPSYIANTFLASDQCEHNLSLKNKWEVNEMLLLVVMEIHWIKIHMNF